MKEVCAIQLTPRQSEIVQLVKRLAPITGDLIAEQLGVSRPTIRSDLSVLVMLGYLDAKPKVGYFLGNISQSAAPQPIDIRVQDVQSMPVIVRETSSVHDAVVALFLENVGSLIVADEEGMLLGVVSRKDLLKVTLGNTMAGTMPISFVMTRTPLITAQPQDSILDAAKKMDEHDIDTLPVVVPQQGDAVTEKWEVVGRVTKTTILKVFLRHMKGW
ncbi:helix-turn-helix transcriptional regulator [Paenibacillus sp. MER TA 81-3]|uniref:helix-turn-helix transcriptional regulator n=1 Tax=Paenibacillus sp. MER TA 81-3 TaxID=2939573 RepID=UPI00203EC4C4|nr:helix-turn-helix transcriptional regulator [Paenibacillus sp. MER TA 81-3]MCM3339023.1 helix-turn-helix transcriptional regulator [Paenibacillus sp. MER TA 81-3]